MTKTDIENENTPHTEESEAPTDIIEELPESEEEPPAPEEDDGRDELSPTAPTLIDYSELAESDAAALRQEFSELSTLGSITELSNPMRYAELRDLGLTPREAYLATREEIPRRNNRTHLTPQVPRAATVAAEGMTDRELSEARDLFSGLSDREIRRLYKKVIK